MRRWIGALGLLLAFGTAAHALDAPPNPARQPPSRETRTAAKPLATNDAKPVLRPTGENEQARRAEDDRLRRWDERMRRATRSMCDRC